MALCAEHTAMQQFNDWNRTSQMHCQQWLMEVMLVCSGHTRRQLAQHLPPSAVASAAEAQYS